MSEALTPDVNQFIRVSLRILCLLFTLATARADLLLVKDHQPLGVIIAGADPSAALAAQDLKFHLDRIAGCDFPLVSAGEAAHLPQDKVRLLIGESPLTAELKLTSQGLEPEAYRIVTRPNTLVIVGRNVQKGDGVIATSPAVLYGTSHLLDRYFGVRWLWPGELGTIIPKAADLRLPELDVTGQPPLSMRSFTTQVARTAGRSSTSRETGDEAQRWNQHHTIGRGRTEYTIGHAFGSWWEKYHVTHPEYFAKPPPGMKPMPPEWVKLCVSEPGVAAQIVAEWKAAGAPESWNICPNDNGGFCTCDRCRALDGAMQDPVALWNVTNVDVTGRYVDLWNRVLRAMKETRPDAKICTYSYSAYKFLKPEMKLEPGYVIEFVGDFYSRERWNVWSDAGAKIALRPNWLHFGGVAPHLPLHAMGDYFDFARSHGMLQFHFDSNFGHYGTQGPNYYLLARMGARPDLSVEAVIGEWCSAFGPAAPAVRRYLDYWEAFADKVQGGAEKDGLFAQACAQLGMRKASSTTGTWRTYPLIYTDAIVQPGFALLDEAATAAGTDETVQARVQFLRDGLQHLVELRDLVALTQGKDSEVKKRIPLIKQKGEALLAFERALTPRHVVNEAVLRSIYEKRGVQPFSKNKPIQIDGL
jgi:hypothetical protein